MLSCHRSFFFTADKQTNSNNNKKKSIPCGCVALICWEVSLFFFVRFFLFFNAFAGRLRVVTQGLRLAFPMLLVRPQTHNWLFIIIVAVCLFAADECRLFFSEYRSVVEDVVDLLSSFVYFFFSTLFVFFFPLFFLLASKSLQSQRSGFLRIHALIFE